MRAGRMRFGRGSRQLTALAAVAALGIGAVACGDDEEGGGGGAAKKDEEVTIGLITKTETNPFFVKMKEGAQAQAKKDNVKLLTGSGKTDTDNASQLTHFENMTTQGAKVILDVPANSKAIVPAIKKARDAGVIVIALDTPPEPQSAVDALFATDNREAGELIGRYAKAKAQEDGIEPSIAMLDLGPGGGSGRLRHEGFLAGFGIEEGDPQIAGALDTEGNEEKAEAAMTQLLEEHPDINIVYSVNEPAAFGASAALEIAGKSDDDVIIVSVDGGCEAIKRGIRTGEIDATSQQYPENMARKGVETLAQAARGGEKPSGYLDTGVELISGSPVDGVESKDVAFGVRNCWGK
jgi:fructose transport system substrate-binding protein